MDESQVEDINVGARERASRGRAAARMRQSKYRDKDPILENFRRPCNHTLASKAYKCAKITDIHVKYNRKLLYKYENLQGQNVYLCRLISPYNPIRRRPNPATPGVAKKPKQKSCAYHLLKKKTAIPVCKKFFLAALSLGKKRVENLIKTIFSGKIPKENRGGDRKSHKFDLKKEAVIKFIKKLRAKESHYNRSKSKRIYLSSELNITKLAKMYNASVELDLRVKRSMFRKVFVSKFNIGFSSPASDMCTYCVLVKNKIKSEKDGQAKQKLITEARIHKLRANAFYGIMKKNEDRTVKYCFDLQQVNPLPRTPIQEAFYSRQISFYNFCVVGADSKSPTFYCWSEEQAGRGSSEVGSALLNFLNNREFTGAKKIQLFADGCGGQNKNKHIVHTLTYWLSKHSPDNIKAIELIFPVRGHSFLPADRVFGRLEKNVSKFPILTLKQDYIEIFKQHGVVKELNKPNGWQLYNIKEMTDVCSDIKGIRNLKRLKFMKTSQRSGAKCVIEMYENYRGEARDSRPMNIIKRGKSLLRFTLKPMQMGREIKAAKIKDVKKLLAMQFGQEWQKIEELKWYVNILQSEGERRGNEGDEEDPEDEDEDADSEEACICAEHDAETITI